MKKALVIVNPTLGADTTGKLREELANHFPRAGIRYEVLETAPGVRTGDVVQARLLKTVRQLENEP